MKPKFLRRRTSLGLALAAMFLTATGAQAVTKNWNGSTSDSWTDAANWDDGVPAAGDNALFNKASYTFDPNYGTREITDLVFGDGTTTTADISLSGTTLKVTGAITVNANSGAATINGTNQMQWATRIATNNSTSLLTIAPGIKSYGTSGTTTFTFTGSGDTAVNGIISNGTGNTVTLTKSGTGLLTLSGSNDYTGSTTIQRGTVIAGTDAPSNSAGAFGITTGTINLGLGGGDVDASILIGGAYTVGRNIRLLTVNGVDNGTRVLTLGGNTAATSEFSGNIILGNDTWAGRGVTLTAASGGQVTFSGVIQNPANMDNTPFTVAKTGAGTVVLSNTNTYTGSTSVSEGTLALGNNDVLPDVSNVSLGAGTLDAATYTDAAGTLNVTGAATINLGSGAKLAFANSSGVGGGNWAGTLTLTGTFVPGNGVDPGVGSNPGSLRFGTGSAGLTADQLLKISAAGWAGFGLDAYGYLTATSTGGNNPPTISDIANQSVPSGGNTGALDFTITDEDVNSVTPGGSSNNITLVPNGNIVFGGSGANRTVTVTPVSGLSGSATITVTITDNGSLTAQDSFTLTVTDNYLSWSTANSVTGGPDGDSNNNGVKNLVEYALADGQERGTLSGNTITFNKRGAPYGGDLTYDIESSTGLTGWSVLGKPPVVEDSGSISYTFTPGPGTPEEFARLKVVQAP